jgi:hypothetical protein
MPAALGADVITGRPDAVGGAVVQTTLPCCPETIEVPEISTKNAVTLAAIAMTSLLAKRTLWAPFCPAKEFLQGRAARQALKANEDGLRRRVLACQPQGSV